MSRDDPQLAHCDVCEAIVQGRKYQGVLNSVRNKNPDGSTNSISWVDEATGITFGATVGFRADSGEEFTGYPMEALKYHSPDYHELYKKNPNALIKWTVTSTGRTYYVFTKSDDNKTQSIIDKYIKSVIANPKEHAAREAYKFDAMKQWWSTFDIEATDFSQNLKDSLSKASNLVGGGQYYPLQTIFKIAQAEPESIREIFRSLFDESNSESERIKQFFSAIWPLVELYGDIQNPAMRKGSIDARFVSFILSLRFPNRFLYYKYTELLKFCKVIYGKDFSFGGDDTDKIIKAQSIGLEIIEEFKKHPDHMSVVEILGGNDSRVTDDNLWFVQDAYWWYSAQLDDNVLLKKVKRFMEDNPDWRESEHWSLTQAQISEAVAAFQDKFSPEKLQEMSDEEILRWIPYREVTTNDGLSYLLEHSSVIGKMGGIGGGSAGKMGYYQGKDGNWKTLMNKVTTQEDVLNHRKIDIDVLVNMHRYIASDDFNGLQSYINGLEENTSEDGRYKAVVPGLVWVRKYFTVLFPDKFVELYGGGFVKKLENVAGMGKINGDGKDPDYSLWYSQMNKVAKIAPQLNITNYELSRIIWDLVNEEQKEEEAMNKDAVEQSETISLNTIIYGPPGTGKTYSIQSYKNQLLANQNSKFTNLIKGSVKDSLLFLFAQNNNTPQNSSDIWRSEQFQKLQEYNGRTKSNEAAVYNELVYNNKGLFVRVEEDRIKYHASQEGLDYIQSVIDSQAEDSTPSIEDFYQFITFHQSYGYEEFIEGIRAETDESGGIRYAVRDGVFKSFCRRAESDPENKYLFVIDEINRANISKVFGELITLLEPSKRLGADEELTTTLPYSGEKFGIPKNVYVIGTMNTADRSIALLDIALRRRFDFVELMPKPELLSTDVEDVDLQKLLTTINAKVTEEIDRNHQIGHSYLMGIATLADLHRAWYQRVVPLLQEYFYDDNDDLRSVLKTFVDKNEVVVLQGEEFKQALIGIYEETQSSDPGIQL